MAAPRIAHWHAIASLVAMSTLGTMVVPMKVKTSVRAGRLAVNHSGMKVKTNVRSGRLASNHNGARVRR